jgi:hypothetical protein
VTLKEFYEKLGHLLEYEGVSPDWLILLGQEVGSSSEAARGFAVSPEVMSFGFAKKCGTCGEHYDFHSDTFYEDNPEVENPGENAIVFWLK